VPSLQIPTQGVGGAALGRFLFQQLVLALDFCHRRGKVCRGVKLANTLLALPLGTSCILKTYPPQISMVHLITHLELARRSCSLAVQGVRGARAFLVPAPRASAELLPQARKSLQGRENRYAGKHHGLSHDHLRALSVPISTQGVGGAWALLVPAARASSGLLLVVHLIITCLPSFSTFFSLPAQGVGGAWSLAVPAARASAGLLPQASKTAWSIS
jgi:serine/threonine protein kinase